MRERCRGRIEVKLGGYRRLMLRRLLRGGGGHEKLDQGQQHDGHEHASGRQMPEDGEVRVDLLIRTLILILCIVFNFVGPII